MNYFKRLSNFANNYYALSLLNPALPNFLCARSAATHRVKRNTRQKRKAPGIKRMDGDFVRRGDIIVVQFGLHFHPGLNVEISSKNTLSAMREGRVMMTCEKIEPKEDSYIAQKYYANMSAPAIYKRYFHVIPFEQGKKFKLVDLV